MNPRELSCEEVIARLFDYLDRELDDRQAAEIEHHLSRCRDCFSRSEFEKRLRARLADSAGQPAPPRLQRRIRRLLDGFDEA
ncbi:anti-sigma factor family protein [Halomonas ramblicola]|uniref:anti-sigma factor family protein n=1 Tax=Halomonas ramblicola TaxID=747349 RepID=UPI0025B4358A|nr:zf-HC2 domain-containing protein [Halomonas ramblicola]MDN3521708.1 zf-HC2 domain-containing protein [Halomonas ramblicola]